ncbi:hypothetical protein DPMN_189256 [Dreissena polymorpha]|uniref:Uncharacterized protein n=1 Tax=Dreissena polymorpha TaxID=45954 RepID=A0A9D4DV87_DREPO|nr:hypothetical protein DPMN_189256 [Dreissena polymorpha]
MLTSLKLKSQINAFNLIPLSLDYLRTNAVRILAGNPLITAVPIWNLAYWVPQPWGVNIL